MVTQLVKLPEPSDPDAGRLLRGAIIATRLRIKKGKDGSYVVPSESPKSGTSPSYTVNLDGDQSSCTCPDFEARTRPCKHVYATQFWIQGIEFGPDELDEAEAKTARPTYGQNWAAYDAAQENEEAHFEVLLRQLCDLVEQPVYQSGRPRLPVSDMIYCIGIKVYRGKSRRRVMTAVRRAVERGLLDHAPSDATITRYMGDENLTPVLKHLVEQSSLPLRALETNFAIDSTGVSTSVYDRWFDEKWGRPKRKAKYLKLHFTCGVNTQIIAAADVSGGGDNDSPFLRSQLRTIAENFDVQQLAADRAYLSKKSFKKAEKLGVRLLVPFKVNSKFKDPKRKRSSAWEQAYHFFHLHNDSFLEHYHERSIAESVVHMIKSKFSPAVFSKSETAQQNEILLKAVCHNIYCLIRTAYELGVQEELENWLSDPAAPGGLSLDERILAVAP